MIYRIVVPSPGATGGEIVMSMAAAPGNDSKGTAAVSGQTDKADMEAEAFRDGFLRCVPARWSESICG